MLGLRLLITHFPPTNYGRQARWDGSGGVSVRRHREILRNSPPGFRATGVANTRKGRGNVPWGTAQIRA
jgi:hypothetical protein